MHQVIVDDLEEYLSGALPAGPRRQFEAHLETCEECRREATSMVEISGYFEPLRPGEALEPASGFYARVMQQVRTHEPALSFWSLFSLDPGFGRRIAFASLLTLAVLGGFLVSRESDYGTGPPSPETVMAEQGSSDRGSMLVTLASYEP